MRYLEDRGLKKRSNSKVWAFLGDGETDEPESLGAITLASREKLDNLIFVINCNLQRLDGPVRGNGQIIQELEAIFRGAGWNVIKVIWGSEWDALLEKDHDGLLVKRMGEVVDGEYQKYAVESGAYVRKHFWGADPRLLEMVKHLSDEQLKKLTLGGHDPIKVYAAYKAAVEHTGQPTVILARTIKGYGIGEAGEGKNITHQQKKLNEDELQGVPHPLRHPDRRRGGRQGAVLPAAGQQPRSELHARAAQAARRLRARRATSRSSRSRPTRCPSSSPSSTRAAKAARRRRRWCSCGCWRSCCATRRSASSSCRSCPTKRAPSAWRRSSARSASTRTSASSTSRSTWTRCSTTRKPRTGRSSKRASPRPGSMSSFIAAGTAYATHGINTIPFFIYYSMFGFQRVGDLVWAAADTRTRGFLLGGTAGRTTLAGEGLQHQDGHSHLLSLAVPNLISYDPAFAYEIAVIIEDGIHRMYEDGESIFYYLTVMNEQYEMPPMPEGARDGILKGMYRLRAVRRRSKAKAARAAARQRRDPQRGAQGAADPRGAVRRRRRRLERDQLPGALSRRPRRGALEPAASRREAARAVRHAVPRQAPRRARRGVRLREGAAGRDRPLAAAAR